MVRVHRLTNGAVITAKAQRSFEIIRERRDDYHHLNPGVPDDRKVLRETAYRALTQLSKIEDEVFAFSIRDGGIVPRNPQFWL